MYFPPIKNPEEITKDPTLRVMKPWWIILIGAAILYLLPAQAVLSQPMVGTAIEWLASLIPSIARWVELSPFPANTKLFFVFAWVMVPVQAYWLWSSKVAHRAFLSRMKPNQLSRTRKIVDLLRTLLVFVPLLIVVFLFAIVETELCRVCANTSRSAQLFIGCLASIGLSGMGVMCLWQVPMIFKFPTNEGTHHV